MPMMEAFGDTGRELGDFALRVGLLREDLERLADAPFRAQDAHVARVAVGIVAHALVDGREEVTRIEVADDLGRLWKRPGVVGLHAQRPGPGARLGGQPRLEQVARGPRVIPLQRLGRLAQDRADGAARELRARVAT